MEITEIWNNNFRKLLKEDEAAKKNGMLVGRYIQEQIADGHAYYKITKENKTTVRIQVVTDIGDDWTISYWGKTTSIPKSYALKSIGMRDKMEEIFSRRK